MDQFRRQVLTLVRNGAYAAAVRAAFDAARRNPTAPECFELLAYAEAMAGYSKAAVKTISRAIELAPDRPAYWYQRGQFHLAANSPREAVDDMARVIEIEQKAAAGEFSARAEQCRDAALSRLDEQSRTAAGRISARAAQFAHRADLRAGAK